jgi:hypothetical protein
MKRAAHGIERALRGLYFFSQRVWATVPMPAYERLYLWNLAPNPCAARTQYIKAVVPKSYLDGIMLCGVERIEATVLSSVHVVHDQHVCAYNVCVCRMCIRHRGSWACRHRRAA